MTKKVATISYPERQSGFVYQYSSDSGSPGGGGSGYGFSQLGILNLIIFICGQIHRSYN